MDRISIRPTIIGALLLLAVLGLRTRLPSTEAAEPQGAEGVRQLLLSSLTRAERCDLAFLEHLGWRVHPARPGGRIEILGGWPTRRPNLAAAQAAGDLRILVPPDAPKEYLRAFGPRLGPLADALPSRLALKHRMAVGVGEAARKMDANTRRGNFTFPTILVIDSPWFRMRPPEPEWTWGKWKCYGHAAPSRAIDVLYTRKVISECYVGQWLMIYATWRELFGAEAFDQALRPEELVIGRPRDMRSTPFGRYLSDEHSSQWRSLVIGPDHYDVEPGLAMAQMGPVSFAGTTGVVENVDEDLFTNDNFVIVSVSEAASEVLRKNGGFEYVRRTNEKIWEIHRTGKRGAIRGSSGIEARDKIQAILEDPVYSEILLYIHPFGLIPLKEIVLERTTETYSPVKIRIYRNGVEDAFYQRYRTWFRGRCMAGG